MFHWSQSVCTVHLLQSIVLLLRLLQIVCVWMEKWRETIWIIVYNKSAFVRIFIITFILCFFMVPFVRFDATTFVFGFFFTSKFSVLLASTAIFWQQKYQKKKFFSSELCNKYYPIEICAYNLNGRLNSWIRFETHTKYDNITISKKPVVITIFLALLIRIRFLCNFCAKIFFFIPHLSE